MTAIKIVVLGSAAVGKSALTIRLVNRVFQARYDPTIEDCYRTTRTVNGQDIVMDVLDTAGQDEFMSVKQQYMLAGNGFFMVYSINSRLTFNECRELVVMLHNIKTDNPVWVLVGNKVDLENERAITHEEAEELAREENAVGLFETSAKNNINVEEAFLKLAEAVSDRLKLSSNKQKDKSKNCVVL